LRSPAYFARHGKPKAPQDLAAHDCINLRMPTLGGVYAWEFEKGSREIAVRVEGQLTVNDIAVIRQAALNEGKWPSCLRTSHEPTWMLVSWSV